LTKDKSFDILFVSSFFLDGIILQRRTSKD